MRVILAVAVAVLLASALPAPADAAVKRSISVKHHVVQAGASQRVKVKIEATKIADIDLHWYVQWPDGSRTDTHYHEAGMRWPGESVSLKENIDVPNCLPEGRARFVVNVWEDNHRAATYSKSFGVVGGDCAGRPD